MSMRRRHRASGLKRARHRTLTIVTTFLAVLLLTSSQLASAGTTDATLTARLNSVQDIKTIGAGFPAHADVSLTYDFTASAGAAKTSFASLSRKLVADQSGAFVDNMAVPSDFFGIVTITAHAKRTRVAPAKTNNTTPTTPVAPSTTTLTTAPSTTIATPAVTAPSTTPTPAAAPVGNGPQYVVDCKAPSGGDGSAARPWANSTDLNDKTLEAGATVTFASGCTYDGRFAIKGNSSQTNPITVRGADATELPTLSADIPTAEDRNAGILTVDAPDVIVENLHFTKTPATGIAVKGERAIIRNVNIDNVGCGIWMYGDGTTVTNVHVRDLHMVLNTPGGDDDYGAIGFNVEAKNITVQESSCTNCTAPSQDYKTDGGFIEIWRWGDGLQVLNNVAENTEGFLEAGGDDPSNSANNIIIKGNTIKDPNNMGVYFNGDNDKYRIKTSNVLFEDNVVTDSKGGYFPIDKGPVTVVNSTFNGKPL